MRRTLFHAAFGIVVSATLVAAQAPADTHPHGSQAATASKNHHAMDDASYVRMMQMHHEQGVKMAKVAVDKAQRAEVKQFAAKTASDQQRDLAELRRLGESQLKATGTTGTTGREPGAAPADAPTAAESSATGHMQMGEHMLEKLESASGAEFDDLFIRAMMMHHQMAIDMSKPIGQFKTAEVKRFADELVKKQGREVKALEAMQKNE